MDASDARRRLESLREEFRADAATETAERELDVSREAMFEARLEQIEDAFARLESGTYGRCIVCNAVIPDERLAVLPDTPFCVNDARREQSRAQ